MMLSSCWSTRDSSNVISKHFKTLQRYWHQDSCVTKKLDNQGKHNNKDHGQKDSNDSPSHCPAWGTVWQSCEIPNYLSRVCQKKSQKDKAHATSTSNQLISVQSIEEQIKIMSSSLPHLQKTPPIVTKVFPA